MTKAAYTARLGQDLIVFDYHRDRFLLFDRTGHISSEELTNPSEHGWLPIPIQLSRGAFVSWIVSPTSRCRSRCRYCFADHYDLGDIPLDRRGFAELGQKASAIGLLRCDLSGGEPLLRPDLAQLLEALLPHVGVMLTTSAIGVDSGQLKYLLGLLPVIQISLDGHLDAMNAPRGGTVEIVRRAIDMAVEAQVRVRVLTVAHRCNQHALPAFAEALAEWGVWEWKILRVIPAGHAAGWNGCLTGPEALAIRVELNDCPLPTQFVGFNEVPPRTCVILEDDMHLRIDHSGRERDLGPVDRVAPFQRLAGLEEDARLHLNYYLCCHSQGGRYVRAENGGKQ